MTSMGTPAFRTLLAACRRWLEPAPGVGDETATDWRRAGRLAFFHGLEPLLHRLAGQGSLAAGRIPADVLATWEAAHYRNLLFNLRAMETLERLVAAARDQRFAFVAFKGPTTMVRAYGDPALRVMVDLDLLLDRGDLEKLGRIAGRLGFVSSGSNHPVHDVATNPETGLALELHFDLYDFVRRRDELIERVLVERLELRLDGTAFPAPPPELALVLEIAHLVSHDFRVSLRNWLDLAALLSRASGSLDWPALHEALRTHGLLPEFLLALEVAAELFALAPAGVPFARPSGYSARARARVIERVAAFDQGFERPALQQLANRRGVGGKISYLRRRLLPTAGRWRALTARRGAGPALAALSRESIRSAVRELARWRSSGIAAGADSITAAVYARNRRQSLE